MTIFLSGFIEVARNQSILIRPKLFSNCAVMIHRQSLDWSLRNHHIPTLSTVHAIFSTTLTAASESIGLRSEDVQNACSDKVEERCNGGFIGTTFTETLLGRCGSKICPDCCSISSNDTSHKTGGSDSIIHNRTNEKDGETLIQICPSYVSTLPNETAMVRCVFVELKLDL